MDCTLKFGTWVFLAAFVMLVAVFVGSVSASSYPYNLFEAVDEHIPVQLSGKKATAGEKISAVAPFVGIDVNCPSWSNNMGSLTLSLYRWKGNFQESTSEAAIAAKTYVDFSDNAWLYLPVPKQPIGEYLWVLSAPTETVGVWKHAKSTFNNSFMNGRATKGDYVSRIFYTEYVPQALVKVSFGDPNKPHPYPQTPNPMLRDTYSDTWCATDALGRRLPDVGDVGGPRPEKYVGLFYWTWNYNWADIVEPRNVSEIVNADPLAVDDIDHPAWGPLHSPHWWGEPLFGYYRSTDPWVLRKHGEMLADIGVDAVFFDCTNGSMTWRESYMELCRVWSEARNLGVKTPQIVFMFAFSPTDDSVKAMEEVYTELYKPGLYRDLWFYWKGKPLVMGYPDKLAVKSGNKETDALHARMLDFFTFRPGQASYFTGPTRTDQWGWLETFPQNGYAPTTSASDADAAGVSAADKRGYEQVPVGVAQNYSVERGLTAMNSPKSFGRSYTAAKGHDDRTGAFMYGLNFQEQWERAFEIDPELVFVTGWNEWIAGRYAEWGGQSNAFPDEFDIEHSRDIEPMRGGFGDAYYLQLASNIRRFKGARPLVAASEAVSSFTIDGHFAKWDAVTPEYVAHRGNIGARDSDGWLGTHYTNSSGRNDIIRAKVARDNESLYFFVEAASSLTEPSEQGWMELLIDADRSRMSGWEGYDFRVAGYDGQGTAVLYEHVGSGDEWNWRKIGALECSVSGSALELRIPFSRLGMADAVEASSSAVSNASAGTVGIDIEFKWVDNPQKAGDIMDFYVSGDTAPSGRFNYRYSAPM